MLYATKDNYEFILLQSFEDLEKYAAFDANKKAHEATNMWFGFKSQKFYQTTSDYIVHNRPSEGDIGGLLAFSLDRKEGPTSISEYCHMADSLINRIHRNMAKHILNGFTVRLNKKGGYCILSKEELNEYEATGIDAIQMNNFLLNGNLNLALSLAYPAVIIENQSDPGEKFTKWLSSLSDTPFTLINNFKQKTIIYTDNDFIKLFSDAIKGPLCEIALSTTGEDSRQITGLKKIIEELATAHNKHITIYVECSKKARNLFDTENPFIKVIFKED
jgi:hypothetical protein